MRKGTAFLWLVKASMHPSCMLQEHRMNICCTSFPRNQNIRLLLYLSNLMTKDELQRWMWELQTARQVNQTARLMGFYHTEMKPWQISKKRNICNLHLLMRKGKGYQNRSRKRKDDVFLLINRLYSGQCINLKPAGFVFGDIQPFRQ